MPLTAVNLYSYFHLVKPLGGSVTAFLCAEDRSMFPKVFLQWCMTVSQCAAQIERRRQGKFQPFRRLFGKRKKKGSEPGFEVPHLRASQSNGDVCNGLSSEDEAGDQRLRDLNSRSLSHDSVFVPEEPRGDTGETMSQDNVSDKVRNLQRQIAQSIKFGPKPHPLRESEGSSDEEDTPTSPLQVQAQVEMEPALSQAEVQGGASAPAAVKSPRPKRTPTATGTIESINLDAVPQSGPRLDNAAARHKLSVKPKNQRISRKHRRITQDLQDVSHPGVLQEEPELQKQAETPSMPWGHDHQPDDKQESKKQKLQEEDDYRLRELQEQKQREEEEKKREEEGKRKEEELREEERQREEEQKREEERQREEVKKLMEEEVRQREEEQKREEEKRQREEEQKREEERQIEEEKRQMEEEVRQREEERKREEKRQREEEEHLRLLEERRKIEELEERERLETEKQKIQELEEQKQREEDKRKQEEAEEEETKRKREAELQMEEEEAEKREKEVQRREEGARQRRAEELRWREMEDRQRPFTFKVSSGEKQILFQKVNLTPVTPSSQQGGTPDSKETKVSPTGSADSPTLPASLYVPHTAILVTGAQLCGAAVNFNQIKDPACKSLLGLAEDKKAMTIQPIRGSGKTKSLKESLADQSSASVLAEWASIRSKIFRGAEGGEEGGGEGGREREVRPTSEDLSQKTVSHSNLRKTLSASAKFSITPARRKFPDANRPSEGMHLEERAGGHAEPPLTFPSAPDSGSATAKAPPMAGKTIRIADGTEGCVFAKDLPSFLVPSPPLGSPKTRARSECLSQVDPEARHGGDSKGLGGEDKPSPFGIKLRRTNFSLRFHSEQSTEKRKKRYSAGDSFDGIPIPLTPVDPDLDSSVFASPTSPLREGSGKTSPAAGEPRGRVGGASIPALHSDSEKLHSRPPLYQKPSISPRPLSATPPPSPLSRGTGGPEGEGEERQSVQSTPQEPSRQEEAELKEKRSFFPSINIPWREKGDRRAELRREKPSLQSRHSLDSARAQEKEAGPLWITLALQKQKGFRDQQLSREERRHMREVKLAEKQAKEKESVFEITDSTTSPPVEKDVAKRFPSSDSPPVSTEPAWLALAKRKAKAWSDCPQIIK
ncbi:hypothetical protein AAFF_G00438130 [Aldrovandia affinis]|uniref:DUF4592 domain-containing protein n=1 Tax=Aldrovandia affinis TaxID=143900 RepID=A0AAD7S890_9TELE|nr:hypothetical protein AAFF_G00438130 [Aldrovandia affinis]